MIYCPGYSEKFECLAGACPDTCCAGWEIIIDDETADFYSGLKTPLGKKIKKHSAADREGNRFFRLCGSRCPFLNKDNLCDIRIDLGVEHTSKICRQHPWFIEKYEGFTEKALGLSCPAVSKIVFSSPTAGAYPDIDAVSDDEVLNILTNERNGLFADFDENRPVFENIKLLFSVAEKAQARTDAIEPGGTACGFAPPTGETIISFTECLSDECEILTEKWKNLLTLCKPKTPGEGFQNYISNNSLLLNRALAYYIYRYFLKAVNTLDCGAYAKFIALSVLSPTWVAFTTGEDLCETFRLYSKEIEHDPDNLDLIYGHIVD